VSLNTFTIKDLRFTFILSGNASFAVTGSNTLTVNGLRASVAVSSPGFPSFPTADATIYGMLQSDMNALIALAFDTNVLNRNTMVIEQNSGGGWTTLFAGQILTAFPDYTSVPNVSLRVTGQMFGFNALEPTAATSYTGDTDVATIVSNIAARMGATFENNGVQQTLSSPYFPGTLTEQLRAVCDHAGIDCYQEPGNAAASAPVIIICPQGQPRPDPAIFSLSPQTGLVGYPVRDSRGFLAVRSIFNPAYRYGGQVNLADSGVANIPNQNFYDANGTWLTSAMTHTLESLTPGGAWFSDLLCYVPGTAPPAA
jgi:hypothetical protein